MIYDENNLRFQPTAAISNLEIYFTVKRSKIIFIMREEWENDENNDENDY